MFISINNLYKIFLIYIYIVTIQIYIYISFCTVIGMYYLVGI